MNLRSISDTFLKDFKEGSLKKILKAVKEDNTLIMELRGKEVIIYYRGGALYTIKDNGGSYSITYNGAYWGKNKNVHKKYSQLSEKPSLESAVNDIALYKAQMDYHMSISDRTLEKQAQQRLVLENNYLPKPDKTGDYFILDIEYAFKKEGEIDARFDAIALRWPSTSKDRRKRSGLGISFLEMKYYDASMSGASGIKKHIDDYIKFINRDEYKEMCRDMETVFKQKCELGLIPAYTHNNVIHIDSNNVDFVFLFVNRDPDSTIAIDNLKEAIESHKKNHEHEEAIKKIYVATSSDMGYVLFRYSKEGEQDRYIQIEDYVNR